MKVSNYDASYAQNRHEDNEQNESSLDVEVQDLYSSMEIKETVEESELFTVGFVSGTLYFIQYYQ